MSLELLKNLSAGRVNGCLSDGGADLCVHLAGHTPAGWDKNGSSTGLLCSPLFYGLSSAIFFGVYFLLWRPLPLVLS